MGNIVSSASTGQGAEEPVKSESETMSNTNVSCVDGKQNNATGDTENSDEAEIRAKAKEEEMDEFKKNLSIKREQRREILARHRAEKEQLERSLQSEKAAKLELCENNKHLQELLSKNNIEIPENLKSGTGNTELTDALLQMREEFIIIKSNNTKLRKDLAETNNALQNANSDIADLNVQNTESMKQIRALKEVVSVSKTMIGLREQQLNELKDKLNEIERTLADRETNLLSTDLRQEYERQLQNIRTLRGLYEERARLADVTRQGLVRELEEHKVLYQAEAKKCKDLVEKVDDLETRIDSLIETIDDKNCKINSCQEETKGLKAEMTVVNKLFSQVLLGYKTNQDLDTLVHRLEENHGILTQMAEREDGSEVSSALPKLLLELVSQIDESDNNHAEGQSKDNQSSPQESEEAQQQTESLKTVTTAADIVENLPKVWKVLIELLSHQNSPEVDSTDKVTTCYKSVDTASGPVLVPSVSQTYIRLKDLIIEKLGLVKEVNHMKQLNTHLETRLEEQERRLCLVTSELSKTWHVVGRLRRHHHQLHTHEKILKYELQQKRKLLNELKEELEYCREKWEQAREKNTQSERDWKKLRADFSSRKTKSVSPSFNNSAESGYSDDRLSDESSESNDESEYVAEPLIRCKKKIKKSFENILDSSTDINLVAEREDPASDMLDVADLPLDTQESEENHGVASESNKSELFSKSEKICEETEDEVADITHDDSCHDDLCAENQLDDPTTTTTTTDTSSFNDVSSGVVIIDPAEILRNIKLQNERLAKKDDRLKRLESNSAALLEKTRTTAEISEQLSSTLDHLINRPATSSSKDYECKSTGMISQGNHMETVNTSTSSKIIPYANLSIDSTTDNDEITDINSATTQQNSNKSHNSLVTQQDFENATELDETHYILGECCLEDNSLNSEDQIIDIFDSADSEDQNQSNNSEQGFEEDNSASEKEDSGPSTSNESNHEARFAARDLRLRRLEEQTKSLVNKVNKTTSKGVKIHYKLEELHNIYGSESSRAGTPSEESEDKNNDNETLDE